MSTELRRTHAGRSTAPPAAAPANPPSNRRLRPLLPIIVLAAALLAPPAGSAAEETRIRLADLDGRWRQIDDPVATQARLQAIESAVEPLTWVVRKMATGVLRSSTAPRPTLDFVWDGSQLHERVPGEHRIETRLIEPGADPFRAKDPRGEFFEGAWDWTRDGLRLRWQQHQAYGSNVYRMSSDRRTLIVDHEIQVTALSGLRPIAYRSHFTKDDLPAVASDAAPPTP